MVLPYLWVGLTLVLLVISINPSQGQAIITEEDLIRYYNKINNKSIGYAIHSQLYHADLATPPLIYGMCDYISSNIFRV